MVDVKIYSPSSGTTVMSKPVPSKPRKSNMLWWVTAFAILLMGALFVQLAAEDTNVQREPMPAPEIPPPTLLAEAAPLLTDAELDQIIWRDDPATLSRDLHFGGIYYYPEHSKRQVRVMWSLVKEGEQIPGTGYTVKRIDMQAAFLEDGRGNYHRLVGRGTWAVAADQYRWNPEDWHDDASASAEPEAGQTDGEEIPVYIMRPVGEAASTRTMNAALQAWTRWVQQQRQRDPGFWPMPADQQQFYRDRGIAVRVGTSQEDMGE